MVETRIKNQGNMKKSCVLIRAQRKKLLSKNPDKYDARLPTLFEFIIVHCKYSFCEQFSQLVGIPGSACIFYKDGIIVRKARIDEVIQKLVTTSLGAPLNQEENYSTLARHSQE